MSRPEHLPLELLETFVAIADLHGDATTAAEQLGISQPSISKRLSALRRQTSDPNGQPWLLLKGKRWLVTPEGQRVRSVVSNLVHRYQEMERFVRSTQQGKPVVSLACGQQAASGFVKTAIEQFLKQHAESSVRLSTPRGRTRIEGVAGGQFDFALVSDSPATIRQVARIDLYIETLFEDRFVLVGNPSSKATWYKQWNALPTDRPITTKELLGLPFILPEPDASRRQQFDAWMHKATKQTVDVVLETGGWQNIMEFAATGLGVGLITQSTVDQCSNINKSKLNSHSLNSKDFPPDAVRLIARKVHGKEEADLTEMAAELARMVQASVT